MDGSFHKIGPCFWIVIRIVISLGIKLVSNAGSPPERLILIRIYRDSNPCITTGLMGTLLKF